MNDLATQELNQLEKIIEKNLTAFYEVGRALIRIRDGKLYGDEYGTFEEYCRKRWDFSRMYAHYLIESTKVVDNVNNCLQKPANEAQARPLTKLDPPQQKEAWQRAVETAPEGKVTAAHVQKVVDEMTGKAKVYKLHKETPVPPPMQPKIPEHATYFATIAISQLERISDDDPTKDEALDMVQEWIDQHR